VICLLMGDPGVLACKKAAACFVAFGPRKQLDRH
jgi:hypothetical protein